MPFTKTRMIRSLATVSSCALALSLGTAASALTFNSTQSGNYNDSNTWAEAGNPDNGAADDVTINAGHTVQVTGASDATMDLVHVSTGGVLFGDNASNLFAGATINLEGGELRFNNSDNDDSPLGDVVVLADSLLNHFKDDDLNNNDTDETFFNSLAIGASNVKLTFDEIVPGGLISNNLERTVFNNGLIAAFDGTLEVKDAIVQLNGLDIESGVTVTVTGPGDVEVVGNNAGHDGTLVASDTDTILISDSISGGWGGGRLRADADGEIVATDLSDGKLEDLEIELNGGTFSYNNSDNNDDLEANVEVSANSVFNHFKDDDTSDGGDSDIATFKSLKFNGSGLTLTVDEIIPGNPANANTERLVFESVDLPDNTTIYSKRGHVDLLNTTLGAGKTATFTSDHNDQMSLSSTGLAGTLNVSGFDVTVQTADTLGGATVHLNDGANLGVAGTNKEPLVNPYLGSRIFVNDSSVTYDNFNEDGSSVDVGGDFVFSGNSTFINTRTGGGNSFDHNFGTFDFATGDPTVTFTNPDNGDNRQLAIFTSSVLTKNGTIHITDATPGTGKISSGVQFDDLGVRVGKTLTVSRVNTFDIDGNFFVDLPGSATMINGQLDGDKKFTVLDASAFTGSVGTLPALNTSNGLWSEYVGAPVGGPMVVAELVKDLGDLNVGGNVDLVLDLGDAQDSGYVDVLGVQDGVAYSLLLNLENLATDINDVVAELLNNELFTSVLAVDPDTVELQFLGDSGFRFFAWDNVNSLGADVGQLELFETDQNGEPGDAAPVVPEPMTAMLGVFGLGALASRRRR